MKVKVDFSNLIETIYEVLNSTRSQKAKELNASIDIGLNMFIAYFKQICNRAIEINDPIIQECMLNLCVLNCTEKEEQDILNRAKKILESPNRENII